MNAQVTEMCEQCETCQQFNPAQQKEKMVCADLPTRPWQKLASDLFEVKGEHYILLADYYSKFVEYRKLRSSTAQVVIAWMKEQFARHGIPDSIRTDNGPPYSSSAFREFAQEWRFKHITSSPQYPQINGFAENQVKVLKRIIQKCQTAGSDLDLAILEWRNTPNEKIGSPSQVLMGRRTNSTLPIAQTLLNPQPITVGIYDALAERQQKQKVQYDKTAKQPYPELHEGDKVRMKTDNGWQPATVVAKRTEPRSYLITRHNKLYRRNRRDIRPMPATPTNNTSNDLHSRQSQSPRCVTATPPSNQSATVTTNRTSRISGRVIKLPAKYQDN